MHRTIFVLALGSAVACGGNAASSDYDDPREPSGGAGGLASGGADPTGGAPSGGGGTGGVAPLTGGVPGAGGTIVEEPCEVVPPVKGMTPCDPLDPIATCPEGGACAPYSRFPKEGECGATVYGTYCARAGQATQGEICGSGNGELCAPGYLCVVGATGGPRCAKLCSVFEPDVCPPGLICGETDVLNYGVCY